MFGLSLSFKTVPLSSLHLALLSGPVCYALHKSGEHTLTPEYITADSLCVHMYRDGKSTRMYSSKSKIGHG